MNCDELRECLLDLAEGCLPDAQALTAREHLRGCAACESRYRETRRLVGDLGAARSLDEAAAERPDENRPSAGEPLKRLGDFQILHEVGRGGMGVVYRARQVTLSREVALKVLSLGLAGSEQAIARFRQEAQAAARLHHTNIVPIYAEGHEQGHFYYAMEFVEGRSLDQVIRAQAEATAPARGPASAATATTCVVGSDRPAGPANAETLRLSTSLRTMPELVESKPAASSSGSWLRSAISSLHLSSARSAAPRDYKRIARQIAEVAEALQHAHEQGVIHRDIKPQNLLLGRDDRLHITDFGLARLLNQPGLTLSAEMIGTPAYMAPEQVQGRPVDARTDIYSLGVTLYELLTCRRPFQGQTYEQVIHAVLRRSPPPPRKCDPHVPLDLETICVRAMEKEPARRFASAADLARELRRYADDYPIVSRRVGPVGKLSRWVRRNPARASAIAAVLLIAVLLPALLHFVNVAANARIDAAYDVLLDDYRDRDAALHELSWAAHWGGDGLRRDMALALADIRSEPEQTARRLEKLTGAADLADAHYLRAWAAARLANLRAGPGHWEAVAEQIRQAEAARIGPSPAGWFFRGQAQWGLDPQAALRSYDRAIDNPQRRNFAQAMLHQGRAMNQLMYTYRDPGLYEKAVSRLTNAAELQPRKAYPRYLLARTHTLAGEIYERIGLLPRSQQAFESALAAAREAQQLAPADPRGYAAEAQCLESRGQWRDAIAAWERLHARAALATESDWSERCAYQMRLHFALGEDARAEALRHELYSQKCGYDSAHPNAEEFLEECILAASAGDAAGARAALGRGWPLVAEQPEQAFLLEAGYRLLGESPPAPPASSAGEGNLSPGWNGEWVQVLRAYLRGECEMSAVEAAIGRDSPDARQRYRLRSGAFFARGVRLLAAGDRSGALEAFETAAEQYDNELYCFRAKMLWLRMKQDPAWPGWIGR